MFRKIEGFITTERNLILLGAVFLVLFIIWLSLILVKNRQDAGKQSSRDVIFRTTDETVSACSDGICVDVGTVIGGAQGGGGGGGVASCPAGTVLCNNQCWQPQGTCSGTWQCTAAGYSCVNNNPTATPIQAAGGSSGGSNGGVGGNTGTSASGGTNCSVDDNQIALDNEEVNFLNLLNGYRQSLGLSSLTASAKLSQMAAWQSIDMATNNYVGHTDSLGRNERQRGPECGVYNLSTASGAEVITGGTVTSTAQSALNNYKGSAIHNTIITNSSHVQVGIARYFKAGSTYEWYWTVDFGSSNDGTVAPILTTQPTQVPTISPTQQVIPSPTIGFYPSPTIASGPSPTQVPTISPTQQVIPSPTIASGPSPTIPSGSGGLFVEVKFPGIGNNSSLGENQQPVAASKNGEIQLTNLSNQQNTNENVVLNFTSGTLKYTLNKSYQTGDYIVKIRSDNSLWKNLGSARVNTNQTTTLTATLVTGDLNRDNQLSLLDYNIFLSCYGTKQCQQKIQADLNLDGKVDEKDLNIFYTGLAKREGD